MDRAETSGQVPRFATDFPASPDGSGFASYQREARFLAQIELPPDGDAAAFHFRSTGWQLPQAVLFRAESAPYLMRNRPSSSDGGLDQMLITVLERGVTTGVAAGRRFSMQPGDVGFFDYAYEYESSITAFANSALLIAREHVPPVFLAPRVHGAVLAAAEPSTILLRRAIEALFETIDRLTLAEAEAAVRAVLGLATVALQRVLAAEAGGHEGSANPVVGRVMAFVDGNIADRDITPALLSMRLGVSRSNLYRAFEAVGGVGTAILRHRLDRAAKELLTGLGAGPSMRLLTASLGFRSEAQFSRAFRKRFGLTPRGFHGLIVAGEQEKLIEQARRDGHGLQEKWIDYLSRRG
ncbi:MAG: helix-turn-helix domain-containing protein [Rhizobiaceae bacterium]